MTTFSTLETMQKMVESYHDKGIGMLKLSYTLSILTTVSFTHSFRVIDMLEKIR